MKWQRWQRRAVTFLSGGRYRVCPLCRRLLPARSFLTSDEDARAVPRRICRSCFGARPDRLGEGA